MPTTTAARVASTGQPAAPLPQATDVQAPRIAPGGPQLLRVAVPTITAPAQPFRPADVVREQGHTAKRVVDLTISLIALLLLLPVMVIIAIAVKLSSPGTVFFLQERVGRHGEVFKVIKFRSMRSGTDTELMQDELAQRRYQNNDFKLAADDPHITWVGRIIRATSLDELPQLINVIKGDMSLVGIRPLLQEELALRTHYDQECYRAMRPGMTGLWQVSGRSSVAHDNRHALDRTYIETWSLWADVKLLARTPIAVLHIGNTR